MFVLNPDPYSLPCYRIGPFQTRDLAINHNLPDSDLIDDYFNERFVNKDYIYTENGRQSIQIALEYFKLNREDVVTILTTSGNFYISGCVTTEIERFCKWSREILPETKLLFVNHEFGYPYPEIRKLKDFNLPIIEDCAGSFFSQDMNEDIGTVGDFVIYSFPKMFPLQIGGLLVSNVPGRKIEETNPIQADRLQHVKKVLSHYISSHEEIKNTRINNYKLLNSKFESLGYKERFKLETGIVPGVFMFKTTQKNIDLPELKKHFYAHGVQCSVFYGEEAFFIPVHQAMGEEDVEYFGEVMKSYMEK